jgi:hypothetical protein
MYFRFLSISTLSIPLPLELDIIEIPLHFLDLLLMSLCPRDMLFGNLFLVEDELLHAILEDIGEGILRKRLRRLLFQHYNILTFFYIISKLV